jgi:glycosyltransferase involved in cell wall biosynthesis
MRVPVSVVIPTYNDGCFVGQAVESALSQTVEPAEIVVVDDGSTDDTRARLLRYGNRIGYRYQVNLGLSAARNAGIAHAIGDWVALLDSDDAWHPQKLERQWKVASGHPDYDLIGTSSRRFRDELPKALSFSGEPRTTEISLRSLVYGVSFGSGSGALISKRCLARAGPFDESLRAVEDLDLWLRIADRDNVARVDEELTFLRVRPGMSAQAGAMEHYHRRVIKRRFDELPALRGKWLWKRVALARMYRGLAIMHFEAGKRKSGMACLGRSAVAWPFGSGVAPRLARTKLVAHELLLSRR